VQRSQVDELFKSLQGGEDLPETEPGANLRLLYLIFHLSQSLSAFEVATKLYPHQKKALTFLLEREADPEKRDINKLPSLWQRRHNPLAQRTSWVHVITQKEMFEPPKESKGSILADDVRYCSFQ
jgi:SWI/SNF-related matrix-associated actin-dependent regulator of chromatin subfamily A3